MSLFKTVSAHSITLILGITATLAAAHTAPVDADPALRPAAMVAGSPVKAAAAGAGTPLEAATADQRQFVQYLDMHNEVVGHAAYNRDEFHTAASQRMRCGGALLTAH